MKKIVLVIATAAAALFLGAGVAQACDDGCGDGWTDSGGNYHSG